MYQALKQTMLGVARHTGISQLIAKSEWRRHRLLILCYHGLSLHDEHEWNPTLYVSPEFFRRRMQTLARLGACVLELNDAVQRLQHGTLPPNSVVLTFDDGFYDFYREAFPVLQEFGFPATVYQTTYYCDYPLPIFNLTIDYLLWRGRNKTLNGAALGLSQSYRLPSEAKQAYQDLTDEASRLNLTVYEKDTFAARLAAELDVNYSDIRQKRMLQLMTTEQLSEIVHKGIDVQLHTHRHRTPDAEALFKREIQDNRKWLAARLGDVPRHFCYPSGRYCPEFVPWLESESVVTAATCEIGMASRNCHPLRLPRLLDAMNVTEADFEGWVSGLSPILRESFVTVWPSVLTRSLEAR